MIGDYKQAKVREIIEDAISQLCAVGLTADGATHALVIHGAIRIEDWQKRKAASQFVAEIAEDPIDE